MRIETAHKILIVSAIAFFLLYGWYETTRWWDGEGSFALLRALAGLFAASFFALYLRSFLKTL